MLRDRSHGVVADSGGGSETGPCWVIKEWIKTSTAPIVKIEVDASIECEDEITDGVGSLDVIGVAVEGLEEPRVLGSYEVP